MPLQHFHPWRLFLCQESKAQLHNGAWDKIEESVSVRKGMLFVHRFPACRDKPRAHGQVSHAAFAAARQEAPSIRQPHAATRGALAQPEAKALQFKTAAGMKESFAWELPRYGCPPCTTLPRGLAKGIRNTSERQVTTSSWRREQYTQASLCDPGARDLCRHRGI